jgi:hypothetical protein
VDIPVSYSRHVRLRRGTVDISGMPVYIPNPRLSWFTTGDYYVKSIVTDSQDTLLNCTEVYFSIAA